MSYFLYALYVIFVAEEGDLYEKEHFVSWWGRYWGKTFIFRQRKGKEDVVKQNHLDRNTQMNQLRRHIPGRTTRV